MESAPKCPQCDRPLRPDAPAGLCLTCLARLGAADPPAPEEDATVVFGPPEEGLPGPIRYFGDYELLEELGPARDQLN